MNAGVSPPEYYKEGSREVEVIDHIERKSFDHEALFMSSLLLMPMLS